MLPEDASTLVDRADRARVRGSDNAPIRVIEVSDFECPYCARFNRETFPALDSMYIEPGVVQYIWIGFPNPGHPRAWSAIEAGFCAAAAGKFWPMHDLLFANQPAWQNAPDATPLFSSYATSLGIDRESFEACILGDRVAPLQVRDLESVLRAGIQQTPFFIVADSIPIIGAAPIEQFVEAIEGVRKEKDAD